MINIEAVDKTINKHSYYKSRLENSKYFLEKAIMEVGNFTGDDIDFWNGEVLFWQRLINEVESVDSLRNEVAV
jgi:hypothetical protein